MIRVVEDERMRVLLWPLCREVFLKSDDALARGIPASELALPDDQLQLVFGAAHEPKACEVQLEEPAAEPRRPHPIAGQLAVQRQLGRKVKRKRNVPSAKAKRNRSHRQPPRPAALVNRPRRARDETSGKKRRPPRRHVWLSSRR